MVLAVTNKVVGSPKPVYKLMLPSRGVWHLVVFLRGAQLRLGSLSWLTRSSGLLLIEPGADFRLHVGSEVVVSMAWRRWVMIVDCRDFDD